jgi:hypothetical protein
LLFSGHGLSRRMLPFETWLLGQDSLVVLDVGTFRRPSAN